ncbi:MAG: hypothetical protein QM645_01055 [Asticcacaulis sp.]
MTGSSGEIPEHKRVLIHQVIKALPVRALLMLDRTLGLSQDGSLRAVHEIVSQQLENHDTKAMIFRPYMPMFEAREDGLSGVQFPVWVLDNLWAALQVHEAALLERLQKSVQGGKNSDMMPPLFAETIEAAVKILRQKPEAVLPEGYDADDQARIADFALYLDIYPTAREAMRRMPEWLGRISAEKAVSIRILFKDSGRVVDDGGLRWLEVVYANLEDGADIMAFVGVVTDRASDRFLSQSELAVFGERVVEAAERAQRRLMPMIRATDRLAESAEMVLQALHLTQAVDASVELTRGGAWAVRIARIRQAVSAQVETHVERLQNLVERVLPARDERHNGRVVGMSPLIEAPSDSALKDALGLIGFCNLVRAGATQGGYAVHLAQAVETAELYLEAYLEGSLGLYAQADASGKAVIRLQFDAIVRLTEALCGQEKGRLARRRVASSSSLDLSKTVA